MTLEQIAEITDLDALYVISPYFPLAWGILSKGGRQGKTVWHSVSVIHCALMGYNIEDVGPSSYRRGSGESIPDLTALLWHEGGEPQVDRVSGMRLGCCILSHGILILFASWVCQQNPTDQTN